MSNLRLSIGGRSFSVACADGEEAHVTMLGRLIEDKVQAAGAAQQNESRMLLFAALMLADEVHELKERGGLPGLPDDIAERLARIADHVENLAGLLEDGAAKP